jgi:hypothetical protein
MMRTSGVGSVFVLGGLLAALHPGVTSAEDFRWAEGVPAGQALEIKGVNGAIEATSGGGTQAEVLATKRGHRSDPADVEIKVVRHPGGVTICAVYPSRSAGRPNECQPGEGGHLGAEDNDVDVHFTVKVPAGVRFVARTVNGSVDADGIGGDVDAHTVNGGIRVSAKGLAQAETVNGSIRATLGRGDGTEPLDFKTVNGSIAVDLPGNANADVKAATVNGDIESDFPLTVKGRLTSKRLSGTLGAGGRALNMETVNGSIRLKKSS